MTPMYLPTEHGTTYMFMRIINMAVSVCFTKLEIWFLLVPFICAGTVSVSWENCSYMTLNSAVLHLGDPLSATCQLKSEGCTFDYRINATSIVWRMNGEEVPRNQYRALNDRMSTVFIPWFNRSKGNLTCHLWYNNSWQLLRWAEVRAGFPPVRPRLLSCISHWTSFLTQSMILQQISVTLKVTSKSQFNSLGIELGE
ncbi:granulocyte colony-stimulating factor receptor-like [Hemiscyllium ocellatum]|uniref:granulocyte colony-stimulating factor receptor-like n=1 Tax=Hemiscyllium ocellatum TaxID=170820 RepID=UPI002966E083|nr:granulocyte colony-stimulating factor receptor-like [Hemiscyllium ocellatum]